MLTNVLGFLAIIFAIDNLFGERRMRKWESYLLRGCELGYRSWRGFASRFGLWLVVAVSVLFAEALFVTLLFLTGYLLKENWGSGPIFWLLLLAPGTLAIIHQWLLRRILEADAERKTGGLETDESGLQREYFVPVEISLAVASSEGLDWLDDTSWPSLLSDIKALVQITAFVLTGILLPLVILTALSCRVAWIVCVGAVVIAVFLPLNLLQRLAFWAGHRLVVKTLAFLVMVLLWLASLFKTT